MVSKLVLHRKKSADSVGAGLQTFDVAIYEGWRDSYGEEAAAAVREVVRKLPGLLGNAAKEMVQRDRETLRERREDRDARDTRDIRVADLRQSFLESKSEVEFMYGQKAATQCGFSSLPDDPAALVETAFSVVETVSKWKPDAEPRIKEYRYTPERIAGPLRENAKETAAALEVLNLEIRESQEALARKNQAIERFDKSFKLAATLTSALLEGAGEAELARNLRPSSRRPGFTVKQEEIAGDDVEGNVDDSALDEPAPDDK